MWQALKNIFIKAGWAPLSVIVLHSLLSLFFGHMRNLDPAMHFLGGAALAYLWDQTIQIQSNWFRQPRVLIRLGIAFSLTCVVALFWEVGEFISDRFLNTRIQISRSETIQDLALGCAGAAVLLLILCFFYRKTI